MKSDCAISVMFTCAAHQIRLDSPTLQDFFKPVFGCQGVMSAISELLISSFLRSQILILAAFVILFFCHTS